MDDRREAQRQRSVEVLTDRIIKRKVIATKEAFMAVRCKGIKEV